MRTIPPYNPLDKANLGASVAEAMLEQPVERLGQLEPFRGAGIYAIYYTGDFEPYEAIAARNQDGRFEVSLYVGKAVSPGARKGNFGLCEATGSSSLLKRLGEYSKSIGAAVNLDILDFHCRFLVTEDIWIPLGEALLISKLSPLWNKLIDGYGNHDPGKGRYNQERSRWDALHPGRKWALKCQERAESSDEIAKEVKSFLQQQVVPTKPLLFHSGEID